LGSVVLALVIAAAVSVARLPIAGADVEERPVAVVDLHVDLAYQYNYRHRSFSEGTGQYPAHLLRKAGVVGVVLPLYVPKHVSAMGPRLEDLDRSASRVLGAIGESSAYAAPGCAPPARGRVRTWFAFEGAAPLGDAADSVPGWVARGVKLFGLVHTYDNALATSSGVSPPSSRGLSDTGRALVERIQSAGGVIDVSHASDPAVRDVIALARAAGRSGVPVVASHSNARALARHPRNLTDDQIRAIAATGGLIGVNFHSPFLARGRRATIDDVVRTVRHLVSVGGADHVAIGSDFEGDIRPPPGLEDVRGFQRLAGALQASGMSRDLVEKVFSRNALRVLCPANR
jgi:membrane dipeptidase